MFSLLWLACRKDDEPALPIDSGEPPPDAVAEILFQGLVSPAVNQVILSFWDDGPPDPEPVIAPDTCREVPMRGPPVPRMLDVGEVTVRIGGQYVVMEGGEGLLEDDYPASGAIWFEADGSATFPEFLVPELVDAPSPLLSVSATAESGGIRFAWASEENDDAVVSISLDDLDTQLDCVVTDDGDFLVSNDDLAIFGADPPYTSAVLRTRAAEVIDGEVLVRAIARHVWIESL